MVYYRNHRGKKSMMYIERTGVAIKSRADITKVAVIKNRFSYSTDFAYVYTWKKYNFPLPIAEGQYMK